MVDTATAYCAHCGCTHPEGRHEQPTQRVRQPSIDSRRAAEQVLTGPIDYPIVRDKIALALDDARTDERETVLLVLDEALDNLTDARTAHEVRGYVKAHL